MTTTERELTEPIDLCTPDGSSLNRDALGWSRRPLHRANLDGCFGRNKRWDYWAVLAGDLVVSCVYSNVDKLGIADVWWVDLVTHETGGRLVAVAPPDGIVLPEHPGTTPLRVELDGLRLEIADDPHGTRFDASWTEPDGRAGNLDLMVEQPPAHESLNVVIPWSDREFNFTSKHQARPATGALVVGDRRWAIGGDDGPESWGVLDVGRGRWPSDIDWNWGGGAGRSGEHVVGIQIGARWTEGSGFTENGLIIDGRLDKIGNELRWEYDWDEPMAPWRVVDPGGQIDLLLTPRYDKHTVVGRRRRSETHQVFGTWSGRVRADDGLTLDVDGVQGFAEEARQHW